MPSYRTYPLCKYTSSRVRSLSISTWYFMRYIHIFKVMRKMPFFCNNTIQRDRLFGNFKKVNFCLKLIAKRFWILTVRSALVFNIAKNYSSVHLCTHFKNKHLIRKCWKVNNRAFTVFKVLTDLFPCQQHLLDFTAITCWLFLWSYTLKTYNASPVCKNHKLHYQPKRQRNANTPLSDDMLWVHSLVGDLYIGQTTL